MPVPLMSSLVRAVRAASCCRCWPRSAPGSGLAGGAHLALVDAVLRRCCGGGGACSWLLLRRLAQAPAGPRHRLLPGRAALPASRASPGELGARPACPRGRQSAWLSSCRAELVRVQQPRQLPPALHSPPERRDAQPLSREPRPPATRVNKPKQKNSSRRAGGLRTATCRLQTHHIKRCLRDAAPAPARRTAAPSIGATQRQGAAAGAAAAAARSQIFWHATVKALLQRLRRSSPQVSAPPGAALGAPSTHTRVPPYRGVIGGAALRQPAAAARVAGRCSRNARELTHAAPAAAPAAAAPAAQAGERLAA
jgi:hypothetical protein